MKTDLTTLPGYLPPGKRPRCRRCENELRPNWETGRVYLAPDEHGPVGRAVIQEGDGRRWCYQRLRVRSWGYILGGRGAGLFCRAACGFLWAVDTLEDGD